MSGLGAKAAWAMDAQAGMSEGVAGRRVRAILEGDWGGWLGCWLGKVGWMVVESWDLRVVGGGVSDECDSGVGCLAVSEGRDCMKGTALRKPNRRATTWVDIRSRTRYTSHSDLAFFNLASPAGQSQTRGPRTLSACIALPPELGLGTQTFMPS
jgi:hypothetical protein